MNRFGVFLVLLGIAVPLICIAFADQYQPKAGVIKNIQKMEEKITVGGEKRLFGDLIIIKKPQKFVIPYRYIFASGVIVAFAGIYFIVIYFKKAKK
jgi:hypothetical protein